MIFRLWIIAELPKSLSEITLKANVNKRNLELVPSLFWDKSFPISFFKINLTQRLTID